jgi:hypothetical protein
MRQNNFLFEPFGQVLILSFFSGRKAAEKISGLVAKVLCFDVYPDNEWIKGRMRRTIPAKNMTGGFFSDFYMKNQHSKLMNIFEANCNHQESIMYEYLAHKYNS